MCMMTLYSRVLVSRPVSQAGEGGQWPGCEVEQRIAAILLHKPGLILSGCWVHLHNLSTEDPADSCQLNINTFLVFSVGCRILSTTKIKNLSVGK